MISSAHGRLKWVGDLHAMRVPLVHRPGIVQRDVPAGAQAGLVQHAGGGLGAAPGRTERGLRLVRQERHEQRLVRQQRGDVRLPRRSEALGGEQRVAVVEAPAEAVPERRATGGVAQARQLADHRGFGGGHGRVGGPLPHDQRQRRAQQASEQRHLCLHVEGGGVAHEVGDLPRAGEVVAEQQRALAVEQLELGCGVHRTADVVPEPRPVESDGAAHAHAARDRRIDVLRGDQQPLAGGGAAGGRQQRTALPRRRQQRDEAAHVASGGGADRPVAHPITHVGLHRRRAAQRAACRRRTRRARGPPRA